MWSDSGCSFEFTRKVKTTHARNLGQLSQLDFVIVVFRDEVVDLAQLSR